MKSSRGTRRNRPGGWLRSFVANLTIVAVLGLLFMPLAGAVAGSGGWTTVEICSVNGPQTIVLDGQGKPDPNGTSASQHYCPFCSAHAGYTLPPPVSPGVALPVFVAESSPLWAGAVIVPEPLFLIGHSPRDPPLV